MFTESHLELETCSDLLLIMTIRKLSTFTKISTLDHVVLEYVYGLEEVWAVDAVYRSNEV